MKKKTIIIGFISLLLFICICSSSVIFLLFVKSSNKNIEKKGSSEETIDKQEYLKATIDKYKEKSLEYNFNMFEQGEIKQITDSGNVTHNIYHPYELEIEGTVYKNIRNQNKYAKVSLYENFALNIINIDKVDYYLTSEEIILNSSDFSSEYIYMYWEDFHRGDFEYDIEDKTLTKAFGSSRYIQFSLLDLTFENIEGFALEGEKDAIYTYKVNFDAEKTKMLDKQNWQEADWEKISSNIEYSGSSIQIGINKENEEIEFIRFNLEEYTYFYPDLKDKPVYLSTYIELSNVEIEDNKNLQIPTKNEMFYYEDFK